MSLRNAPFLALVAVLVVGLVGCEVDDTTTTTTTTDDHETVDYAQVDRFNTNAEQRIGHIRTDLDRLEQRTQAIEQDDREGFQNDLQDMRSDLMDVEQRVAAPDTTGGSAWRSHRDGVHSDLNDLESRADRKLIETAPERDDLEQDVRTRLERIDQMLQNVGQDRRPTDYQERRNDIEQRLAELQAATVEQLDSIQSDLESDVSDLRSSAQSALGDYYDDRRDTTTTTTTGTGTTTDRDGAYDGDADHETN
jgi:hypothetical protein